MFFKSLIAAACIAILAVTGVYFMDRQNQIEADRAAAERQATIQQAMSEDRAKAKIAECAPYVRAYDLGDYNKPIQKYGFTQAKPAVESCRRLMNLMGVKP